MAHKVRVEIKKDYNKAKSRKDGTNALYLFVEIGKTRKKFPLDINWPLAYFDESQGICMPRDKADKDYNDNNLMIRDEIGKANEVFKFYRISNQVLTMDQFIKEFTNPLSKTDFIDFFEQKLKERYSTYREIEHRTYQNQLGTLKLLKEFKPFLPFNQIDKNFAKQFEQFLKKKHKAIKNPKTDGTNTRWGRHRDVITYLNFAKNDKIMFCDPYVNFKKETKESTYEALSKESLNKPYEFYKICKPGTSHRRVLQKFLFSCYCSLRISDIKRLTKESLIEANIKGQKANLIMYVPYKTRKAKGQIQRLYLNNGAMEFIIDSLNENSGKTLFYNYVDQYENRILKAIAEKLEITENMHHHVGRETYGTKFMERGGSLEVLQKIFGHSKISTTMKYVKVDDERQATSVFLLDNMCDLSSAVI